MKNICKSHEKHMENENDNVNTNKNEDKNKYIDPIPFLHETFRNQKFLDAWKNWIDYRVEAKVKNPYYLTSSIGKALNHLRTLSGGSCLQAICLIDLAISKQWQGFYADSPIQIQTNTHTEKPLSMEEASKLTEQFGLKKDKV